MIFTIPTRLMLVLLLLVACLFSNHSFAQEAAANPANPGNTGSNAFEFIKYADDIDIGDKIEIKFELSESNNTIGEAKTLAFFIRIPIQDWVTIGADYRVEDYINNPEAVAEFGIPQASGIAYGDLNFWTMIKLMQENGGLPGIALKVTVKTASGDFVNTRRYTDTAGYEFSVVAEKAIIQNENALLRKLYFIMEAGMIVWDTNQAEQNDAYKVSGVLKADVGRLSASAGFLHYQGWQRTGVDNYLGIQAQVSYRVNNKLAVDATYKKGITNASENYYGVGVRYKLNKVKDKKKKKKKRVKSNRE